MSPSEETQPTRATLLGRVRNVVVKVGSGVLANEKGLDIPAMERVADAIAALRARGLRVTLVSSGAIAAGRPVLGTANGCDIPERQATAAVGQIRLMAAWERAFARHATTIGQVLLDSDDLASRSRCLNAEHTLATLDRLGALAIVNENDTVAVEEIKFGDNDTLSALVASLVEADLLLILSDVDGLYERDPSLDPKAERIAVVERVDAATLARSGESSGALGTGGMRSKLLAAQRASLAGIAVAIVHGGRSGAIERAFDAEADEGTFFLPQADRLARRKHWIAYGQKPRGDLHCDGGAREAIVTDGRSLLPSGITAVEGRFQEGDCIRLRGPDGQVFAHGLSNYAAAELKRIAGRSSGEAREILGYQVGDAVVHRDDLTLIDPES